MGRTVYYDLHGNEVDPPKADPVPVTNADLIRAMSYEELAEWLGDMLGVYPFGTEQWDRQAWLDWLKKEAEEWQR